MSQPGAGQAAQPAHAAAPFAGLYDFIRTHLFVVNGLVLSCGTIVAALDFLAPRLSVLPKIVYATTAILVVAMMAAAIAPAAFGKLLGMVGLRARPDGAPPLWRHPAWQFGVALLLGVTIAGFASVAKASDGGLISGAIPAARTLQEALLGLHRGVADIRTGMDAANAKLDRLVADSDDPQRELVSRGYQVNGSGLAQAIKLGDKKAVGLFVKIGYRVETETPLAVLLNGDRWDGELAAMLPRSMFTSGKGCLGQGAILVYEGREPVSEKIETLKRLCDTAPLIQALEADIQRDAGTQPPNNYFRARREARAKHLPMLTG